MLAQTHESVARAVGWHGQCFRSARAKRTWRVRFASEAQRALRALEQRNVSIQDMVIADRKQRTWRKLRDPPGMEPPRQYLMLMIADPPEIERVRALLRKNP